MARLHKAFPKVDLRFKLISNFLKGPVDDVDLGMRYLVKSDPAYEGGTFLMPELLVPVCSLGYHDQHRQPESPIEDTLVTDTYRRTSISL